MSVTAGVIAVQGDVSEHVAAVERLAREAGHEVTAREVREAGVVPDCDWLAMPGGESTTVSRLLHEEGIAAEIVDHVEAGRPLLATCAGLIVAATDPNDERVESLGLVDVTVRRNAFGRQADSEVLARWDGDPVAVRDGPVLATSFHPELTGDDRLHRLALLDGE
ncbi:pyridoxal 5'-phosphate synthase glutaminase subunit PdxT [Halobacteriales archaeon SW_5_70_135]|nr:MAG: pyridoxal 5'-phosphate synthase glutaminase subunit PdxT [Halobacteriales archaeon SW_5_70_135]